MEYDYKIKHVGQIPLKQLVLGKGQVRQQNVSKEIDELADSIRKLGQLEPIVVCPSDAMPGKYEILIGQRRFLACKELGKNDIWAVVLDKAVSIAEAKAISLTENLVRRDLEKSDLMDVCTYLYKFYGGDHKIIAEKTGLPINKVKDLVGYIQLSQELKELVDKGKGSGGVELKTALRTQRALEKVGKFTPQEAMTLAKQMQGLTGAQQTKAQKELEKKEAKDVVDVIEAVKTGKEFHQITVIMGKEEHKALQKYAVEEGMNQDDAAQSLITEALSSKGYLGSEE